MNGVLWGWGAWRGAFPPSPQATGDSPLSAVASARWAYRPREKADDRHLVLTGGRLLVTALVAPAADLTGGHGGGSGVLGGGSDGSRLGSG